MNLQEVKAKLMEDPEFKKAYENPSIRSRISNWLFELRMKRITKK